MACLSVMNHSIFVSVLFMKKIMTFRLGHKLVNLTSFYISLLYTVLGSTIYSISS